ncbi:TonB-dependent receptor plug domain-containing protein [Sphingobacterium griseoflavum]|nr:TonB-dependent receptor plug domain-containing protein [Sphingobacterium griseoflavum]
MVHVIDGDSGVPIENTNVIMLRTDVIRRTDRHGIASIFLSDTAKVAISHVSFRDTTILLTPSVTSVYVTLYPRELPAVAIYAGEPFNKKAAKGVNRISLPVLTAVPSFLGEPDILKGLTFLPGVSEGREGYSHLFVRGGDQDQNQMLLDGATLFNVNHFGGFISMFHPEMIDGVDFYKNYWPSRFGGRLSSVLDIKTKEGNYKEHHQSFQFGLIAPKFNISGPLIRNKLSYQIGMRRTLADLITEPIAKKIRNGNQIGDIGSLLSQDMTLRLDGRLGIKQHLALSALLGRDKYAFLERKPPYNQLMEDWYRIKNDLLTLNYSRQLGMGTTLNAHASYSAYRHAYADYSYSHDGMMDSGSEGSLMETASMLGNGVTSMKFNVHGKTQIDAAWEWNYGIESERLDFSIYKRRQATRIDGVMHNSNEALQMNAVMNTAVASDISYTPDRRFHVNTGIRLSTYAFEGYQALLAEPKILLTYVADEKSTVNAAFNFQRQSTMLLGFIDDIGRFREFYIANDGNSPIASSKQWSIGYFRNAIGMLDNISLELFYKDMSDVVKFVPSIDFESDVLDYADFLHSNGHMRAYGLEVFIQKTLGKWHGSLSYTYAHSKSRFPTLNESRWFNSDFDFRNSLNALAMYSFGRGYRLAGSWTYKTGRPFTLPTSRVAIEDWRTGFLLINDLNNRRMPAFHRLDMNIERRWTKASGNKKWFAVGVYNIYNRVNPFFARPSETPGQLEVVGMFPIMPFFNFGFEL